MLSREQSRVILKRIVEGVRPGVTLAVWNASLTYAEWNTGNIPAPVQTIAAAAGTTPTEVYRALSHLVELGALIRTARGRYAVNPDVAWSGTLVMREEAAELTPA
jgi:predicted transcriptional regulator of viral defense system